MPGNRYTYGSRVTSASCARGYPERDKTSSNAMMGAGEGVVLVLCVLLDLRPPTRTGEKRKEKEIHNKIENRAAVCANWHSVPMNQYSTMQNK